MAVLLSGWFPTKTVVCLGAGGVEKEKNFDSGVQGPKMVTGGWVGKISRVAWGGDVNQ